MARNAAIGGRGVLMLMAADETWRRQIEQAAFVLEDKTAIFFPNVVIPPPGDDRRTQAPRLAIDHSHGGVFLALTIASTPGLRIQPSRKRFYQPSRQGTQDDRSRPA